MDLKQYAPEVMILCFLVGLILLVMVNSWAWTQAPSNCVNSSKRWLITWATILVLISAALGGWLYYGKK